MPHIVFYVTKPLYPSIKNEKLMESFIENLCAYEASFLQEDCKARVFVVDDFYLKRQHEGKDVKGYIHIELHILSGREESLKQRLSKDMALWTMSFLKNYVQEVFELTFAIVELNKQNYVKLFSC